MGSAHRSPAARAGGIARVVLYILPGPWRDPNTHPMPCRQTTAKSPVRAALLLAAYAALPAAAWAARPMVAVFQVDAAGQSAPAVQQAMRDALVRATGRRESASDPAFAGLIANAAKYVESYGRGPQGEVQVIFNGAAVDKAIAALDRSIWDPSRPFTLVVLYPPPDQADQAADQAGLEQAAQQRGLPISIVPLPVTDDSGNLLPREALLELAHRYGAEELLVGRPPAAETAAPGGGPGAAGGAPVTSPAPPAARGARPPSAPSAPSAPARQAAPQAAPRNAQAAGAVQVAAPLEAWQWTLYTDFASQSWGGPLTAGIDATVDLLAPPAGPASANAAVQAQIEIEGVSTLADYGNIELMLGAVPGVSAANVREVSGGSVVFDLTVRGGSAAIARELSGSPSFTRIEPAAAEGAGAAPAGEAARRGGAVPASPLVFRYRSG